MWKFAFHIITYSHYIQRYSIEIEEPMMKFPILFFVISSQEMKHFRLFPLHDCYLQFDKVYKMIKKAATDCHSTNIILCERMVIKLMKMLELMLGERYVCLRCLYPQYVN